MNFDGSLAELLESIHPATKRAAQSLMQAGVDNVPMLLRLREGELRALLGVADGLLPLDRILLMSRLGPHLAQS